MRTLILLLTLAGLAACDDAGSSLGPPELPDAGRTSDAETPEDDAGAPAELGFRLVRASVGSAGGLAVDDARSVAASLGQGHVRASAPGLRLDARIAQ